MSSPQMVIPNVPTGKIVDDKGMMTTQFESFLIQLLRYLQVNISNTGFVNPPLTTTQIALLTNALDGTIVYNSSTDKLMGREAGTFVNLV